MTLEEARMLTDEELRVKVAELCGWKRTEDMSDPGCPIVFWERGKVAPGVGQLPFYSQDLNAMHEAEGRMKREEQRVYTKLLHPKYVENLSADWCLLHATARSRAEAFVAAMGE